MGFHTHGQEAASLARKTLAVPQLQSAVLGTSLNAQDTSDRNREQLCPFQLSTPDSEEPQGHPRTPTAVPWGDFLEQPPRVPSGTRLRCSAVQLHSSPRLLLPTHFLFFKLLLIREGGRWGWGMRGPFQWLWGWFTRVNLCKVLLSHSQAYLERDKESGPSLNRRLSPL